MSKPYPIGTPGRAWNGAERDAWRARQARRRSYVKEVVRRVDALEGEFARIIYGRVASAGEIYPLYALCSRTMDPALPTALITGGVHGYETSGVMGALAFLERSASRYAGRINFVVAPCVSPWSFETVNRWNYDLVDPNRSFVENGPDETSALIAFVDKASRHYRVHIDLHETTDSDNTEFGPARSARDGEEFIPDPVPDGFYLVADGANVQLDFQRAIIAAVAAVTHIALPDERGTIIGEDVIAPGVIAYPCTKLGLCASITGARFRTSTEVYPDSGFVTDDLCVSAQVTAIEAALDYALSQGGADGA